MPIPAPASTMAITVSSRFSLIARRLSMPACTRCRSIKLDTGAGGACRISRSPFSADQVSDARRGPASASGRMTIERKPEERNSARRRAMLLKKPRPMSSVLAVTLCMIARRTCIEQLNARLRPRTSEFLDRLRQNVGRHQQSGADREGVMRQLRRPVRYATSRRRVRERSAARRASSRRPCSVRATCRVVRSNSLNPS